jgi:hypothetical protein
MSPFAAKLSSGQSRKYYLQYLAVAAITFLLINLSLHSSKIASNCSKKTPPPTSRIFQPNSTSAVPSVAIIGTAKGGTTDVFYQLTKLIPELSHSFNERGSEGGNTKELSGKCTLLFQ